MAYRALILLLALALVAPRPAGAAAQKQPPKKAKKVWSNEDLEALREKGRVSVTGAVAPASEGEQPGATEGEKAGAKPAQYVKEKDPKWYGGQLAPLRAELTSIDEEIRKLREFRSAAKYATGGIVLGQANIPLNPENQIELLEKRKREVQAKIDELEEQARRNDIPPGAIR